MTRTLAIARYELKMQLRSIVFWLGAVLVAVMLYSEVVQPAVSDVRFVRWVSSPDAPVSLIQGDASFMAHWETLRTEGVPARIAAPVWADRMAIVFTFVSLFIAGFVFERDRLAGCRDTIDSRPIGALQYFAGKYLGVVAALLIAAALTLLVAVGTDAWAQAALGHGVELTRYVAPAAVLLVTLFYVPALVMLTTLLLGRAAAVIPAFLIYLYTAIAVWPVNFILRSDDTASFWTMVRSGAVAANRLAYLGATIALILVGGWLYGRRRAAR